MNLLCLRIDLAVRQGNAVNPCLLGLLINYSKDKDTSCLS